MKILVVYLFCTKGGVETALNNRLLGLKNIDVKIDILFFQDYGGKELFSNYKKGEVIIEDDLKRVKRRIEHEQYDAIILLDTYQMIPFLQDMHYKGKVILEAHSTYADTLDKLKYIRKSDISYITVPSKYQRELIKKYLRQEIPIYILPNSLDLNAFCPHEIEKKDVKKILLWVGRLDEHKNWKAFLKICGEILKIRNEFDFWIVGGLHSEEKQKNEFQDMILELGLYKNIRWIPACSYDKIAEIYNYAGKSGGGYVVTSKNESFGMTVLEAMACKCPVIVNDVGALPELVDNSRGLKIDIDKEGYGKNAMNIVSFLENEEKTCTEDAFNYVKRYSNENVAEKFIKMLAEK